MSLGWLRCIPLQLVLAAVVVEMSVAQMLKLHLSFVTVSVAVVAGLTTTFFCLALNVAKRLHCLFSKYLKVFLL